MLFLKVLRSRTPHFGVQPRLLWASERVLLRPNKLNSSNVRPITTIVHKEDPIGSVENTNLATEWSENFSEYTSSKDSPESLKAAGKLISLFAHSKPTPFWRAKMRTFYEELYKGDFQLGNSRDYGGLFKAFNRLGMLHECEEAISALKRNNVPLNTFIYNNYLELVGRTDCIRAFSIYTQMLKESLQPNVFTYNLLLRSYKIHNDTSGLSRIISDMDEASIEKDLYTYSTLISTYVNTEKYNKALELYNEMVEKKITPDASIYTSMINLYTKSREVTKATEIYHTMLEQKVVPDVVTFSSLISLYSKMGDIQKMKEVFQTMQESGVEPNVVIYSTIIHAAAKHSGLNEAKELYREMIERRIEPNAVALSTLVNAYIMDNQLTPAIDLFNDALQKGYTSDIILINDLIYGCTKEDINLALPLYDRMKEAGIRPNLKTYNLLIGKGYTKLPYDTLMSLLQDMENYQISPSPSTYYSLLRACRIRKKSTSGDSLYLQMIQHGITPDTHSIRMLMELHSRSKNYNQTLHYFNELKKWNLEPDSNICALAIKSYNYLGRHDEVMKLWNYIQLQGFSKESQLSLISSVIDSCGFASDEAFLQNFWDYVKPRYPLNSNHFSSFIEALCRLGNTKKAKQVFFEEMTQYGVTVNIKVCQTLITQLKNRGSPQDVVQIINFMMKSHPRIWATLIKNYH